MNKKIIMLLILFLAAYSAFSQTEFQKHFGTFQGDDFVKELTPTTDGGFVVTGYTTSSGKGDKDVYLAKFDDDGNIQWSRTYGAEP